MININLKEGFFEASYDYIIKVYLIYSLQIIVDFNKELLPAIS